MKVKVGRHAGQSQELSSIPGDAGVLPECEVKTLMTSDHTAFQVRSSL